MNPQQNAVAKRPQQSPIYQMAAKYNIEPQKLCDVLRNTVIKDSKNHQVTNEELAAFIIVANQYGLNPFCKEIHAFASQGGIVPIVGVDGWAALINRRDEFDGCEFEEQTSQDGTPLCTTCRMYVKGRNHPVAVTEWFSECKRPSIPWQTMPRRMLRHKAFMQAARLCFGLSGIYDEDEARDIMRNQVVEPGAPPIGKIPLRAPRKSRETDSAQQASVSQWEKELAHKQQQLAREQRERQPGEDDETGDLIPDDEPSGEYEETAEEFANRVRGKNQ